MPEPENVVLHLLREEMREIRSAMATKGDVEDIRAEVHSQRADIASDLLTLEKRVNDQFVALRRSVMEYHSTAVGHASSIPIWRSACGGST
jgi:hypothetical protein